MNNQNRTANGKFASVKEAQRSDCKEMIERYRAEAKQAIKSGATELVKKYVASIAELRAAFFADYTETV